GGVRGGPEIPLPLAGGVRRGPVTPLPACGKGQGWACLARPLPHRPTNRNAAAARMQANAATWRQLSASPSTNTMNSPNTVSAIASCAILSWPGVHPLAKPMRFAGTASEYSIPASSHEIRITQPSGRALATSGPPLRCQYQATVMNTLERVSRISVGMAHLRAARRGGQAEKRARWHRGGHMALSRPFLP